MASSYTDGIGTVIVVILIFIISITVSITRIVSNDCTQQETMIEDCQKAYNVYQCEYNKKGAYVPKEVK